MKIKILATGMAPDYYTINGEVITAHLNGRTEQYDLTAFPEGGVFQGADQIDSVNAIRHIERTNGELKVTLCQQVGPGHWKESDWMESTAYNPDAINVVADTTKTFSGKPWVKTRQGKISPSGTLVA